MTERRPIDETMIRAIVTTAATTATEAVLTTGDIARIVVEGNWAAVVVRAGAVSRDSLAVIHRRLTTAFPDHPFEIRAGPVVYRGGSGFGRGRHVVAVLGGKGGVGKSTTALNLALTLAAMGNRTGLVDGDLNAPDVPHLLGVSPALCSSPPPSSRLVDAGLDVLGRLPFDVTLTAAADGGRPLVLADSPGRVAREFAGIARRVRRWLTEREAAADRW